MVAASIGPDLKPTYPSAPDPDENYCETATANICTTTLSYGVVAKRSADAAAATQAPRIPFGEFAKLAERAITTATSTISFCTSVTGCGATDITKTTTAAATVVPTVRVVIPLDPMNVAGIRAAIQQQPPGTNYFFESKTDQLGTNFFFLPYFTDEQTAAIKNNALVRDAYVPRGMLTVSYYGGLSNIPLTGGKGATESGRFDSNNITLEKRSVLSKRAENIDPNSPDVMVALSWPPNTGLVPNEGDYKYDSSAGLGTYVYSCDYGATPSHPEFSDILSFSPLFPGPFPVNNWKENDNKRHGTKCLSKAVGKTVGIARNARVVATVFDFDSYILEHYLDGLALIHEDIYVRSRGTKSVVNLSISIPADDISAAFQDRMGKSIPPPRDPPLPPV